MAVSVGDSSGLTEHWREEEGDGAEKTMTSASVVTGQEDEELDWTSRLPDELVVSFLSKLTLKEAVRTSVLSRRWIPLWKSSDLVLDFDALEELAAIHMSPSERSWPLLVEKRRWLKNWVNGVVRQLEEHNSLKLKKFRVVFNFNYECNAEGDIDRWVEFAISNRVESFELFFITTLVGKVGSNRKYDFSEDFYKHIKTPAGLLDIKPLRSLRLSAVNVEGETLEHFISNCPLLEELAVQLSDRLHKLRVVGSSQSPLRLKYLEVRHCIPLEFWEIDHAPCLTHLIFDVYPNLKEWRIGKCPCLVDLILSFGPYIFRYDVFKGLNGCVSQLEHLLVKTHAVDWLFQNVAEHTRLERMTVEVFGGGCGSLLVLVPLINASPRLHTLQVVLLTYQGEELGMREESIVKMRRESIKAVEIIGFRGNKMEIEFVEYVMEYFVGLEKIVIDRSVGIPLPQENSMNGGKFNKLCSKEEAEEAEKLALGFKSRAPPTLEFVVL